jgi:crotonobetaine/carnitine-CoA ligase
MLAEAAERTPAAVFIRDTGGDVSYTEAQRRVAALAGGLENHGVSAGTPVALFMANSAEQVVVWFALARLGALHVPLNPALTGSTLRHALRVAAARVVVADAALVGALAAGLFEVGGVDLLVVNGDLADCDAEITASQPAVALAGLVESGLTARPHPTDELGAATLLFTSGTSGPAKACALSHRYLARQGQIHARQLRLDSDDVLYCPFPLFHIDAATLTVVAALSVSATAALGARFSASGFWDEVRRFDASVFNFMGATLTMLWKQAPSARDRDHRVRLAWGVPMPEWKAEWEERFGIPLFQVYGLTDAGVPVYDPIDGAQRPGRCGRVIEDYELRVEQVASDDPGTGIEKVGEILVRGREPGLTMNEYHGMPEATAATVDPEGWVRTGDLGSLDESGYLAFHGRLSDSIRRRGENISAFEVEELLASHPDVLEAAAIGVPSPLTEEDVKVCVTLRPGSRLAPADLFAYCRARAPAHIVPRYIEIVPALPKTPTQKVEKFRLVQSGITRATWDAEQARSRGLE